MARTDKKDIVINGYTIHSYKEGLGIPVSYNYLKLGNIMLKTMREILKKLN